MRETTARFYTRFSSFYSLLFDETPVIRDFRQRAVKKMELNKGDRVIEIGCGTGANFAYIKEEIGENGEIVGIDISGGMLKQAKLKIEREGWENIHLIKGDASHIEIKEEFDAVLFSFSINFFDVKRILDKWSSKIEEGVLVIIHDAEYQGRFSIFVDKLVDIFTILSGPPFYKLNYEELQSSMKENIRQSHAKMREISEEFSKERKVYGLVEIDVGKIKME